MLRNDCVRNYFRLEKTFRSTAIDSKKLRSLCILHKSFAGGLFFRHAQPLFTIFHPAFVMYYILLHIFQIGDFCEHSIKMLPRKRPVGAFSGERGSPLELSLGGIAIICKICGEESLKLGVGYQLRGVYGFFHL